MKLTLSMLAGAAAALAFASTVHAADLLKPANQIYSSPLFNFEGLYAGAQAGGAWNGGTSFGSIGVVVGSNFDVTNGIILGGEFQGDAYFSSGTTAFDALALGRAGGFITDNILLTGDLGVGVVDVTPVYALGGAAEFGLSNSLSVRGDLQFLGQFGASPSATRATIGLLWHMN
jgi:outer membrane immunogenic protein